MYIDTHVDTVWHVLTSKRDFALFSGGEHASDEFLTFGPGMKLAKHGHVDVPRGREGGFMIGFFTGFPSSSFYVTERMVRDWLVFMDKYSTYLTRIRSLADLDAHLQSWRSSSLENRKLGVVFSLEGAAGLDTELNRLYLLYDIGLRSMGLTWNEQNQFATGVHGNKDRGLTAEGRDLVFAAQDLGIIIDVSHLNDKSFWDVHEITRKPLIASHSNLRRVANHPRNLTDDMALAIKATGGSIGVNFHTGFLKPEDPESATKQSLFDMFKALIDLVGVDHVHVGTDFDGSHPPKEIRDVRDMPIFFDELQEYLGLSSTDLKKIQYENILRVMRATWKK